MLDSFFGIILNMTENEHIASLRQAFEDCRRLPGESHPSRTSALINLVKLKEFISSAQACGHNIQTLRFNSTEAISFHCALCEKQTRIDRVDMADLNQTGTRQKRKKRADKDRSEPMGVHGSNLQHNLVRGVTGVVDIDVGSGSADEVTGVSAGGTPNDSELNRGVASTSGCGEGPFEVCLRLNVLREAIEVALACDHNIQELRESDGLGFYCFLCKRKTAILGAF